MEQHMRIRSTRPGWLKRWAAPAGAGAVALLATSLAGPQAVAAAGGLSTSSITFETRQYLGSPVANSPATAISTFNGLSTGAGGYTNAPMALSAFTGINNQSFGGSFSNIGYHFHIAFGASGPENLMVRVGPDFGYGGTLLLDGAELQSKWFDLWWNFNWGSSQLLTGSAAIAAGAHAIDIYGFEGCCDGPMEGQYSLDGGTTWRVFEVSRDTTPPTVSCSSNPSTLWPPNHKLANVSASVSVTDSESGPAGFTLLSVTSSEPDNGLGDGDTANDIQGWSTGTADTSGQLRAERSGTGSGRTYTLTYQGVDAAGNSATCATRVTVPHDQRP